MHESKSPRSRILVWSWNIAADRTSSEVAETLLSEDEKQRGRRFVSPVLQQRFMACHARLRSLLGDHLGRDPRTLVFIENEFGKPRLANAPSMHFSLSHSEDQALLAVSEGFEVGADIERIRTLEHLDLARRYFHPNEIAAIESLPRLEDQLPAFFHTWTLKEAFVKALGTGLSLPLDAFEVSTSPPALVFRPEGAPQAWWLHLMAPMGGYCRALAASVDGDLELIQRTF